jgi:hypothetical protein
MHTCEDNIKIDLNLTGYESMNRIHLVQNSDLLWALVDMIMNLTVTKKADNFLTSLTIIKLYKGTVPCRARKE